MVNLHTAELFKFVGANFRGLSICDVNSLIGWLGRVEKKDNSGKVDLFLNELSSLRTVIAKVLRQRSF